MAFLPLLAHSAAFSLTCNYLIVDRVIASIRVVLSAVSFRSCLVIVDRASIILPFHIPNFSHILPSLIAFSLVLRKVCSSWPGFSCDNIIPHASFHASVLSINGLAKEGYWKMFGFMNPPCVSFSNACWHS